MQEFTEQERQAIFKAINRYCQEKGIECYGIDCIEDGRVWFMDNYDNIQEVEWEVD